MKRALPIFVGVLVCLALRPASAELVFNFDFTANMTQQSRDGFTAAGQLFSSRLMDDVVINLDVDFRTLGAGTLGQASTVDSSFTYSQVRNALASDQRSASDMSSVMNLPGGSSFNVYINRTSDNPNGSDSPTPYLDNDGGLNNTSIVTTRANAKALGLLSASAPASDGSIAFNSSFTWDFDPSDGITSGAFDFVGIAAHEIGHALGFVSGVDILDDPDFHQPAPAMVRPDNFFNDVTPLDLHRFSILSEQQGAIDFTIDTRDKYFSIDGGATDLGGFSTGVNFGDGRQASHWKDNMGLGIMDPTSGSGELLVFTELDTLAFDVIGWDLSPVPEPGGLALGAIGIFIWAAGRRRFTRPKPL